MLIEDQHPLNRHLTVAVLGIPNAGKSSIINKFLGFDLSAVTSKPQTTRNQFHCVYHNERVELVFVDTPGLHGSTKEFNKRLNEQAREGAIGADLNLLLLDLSRNLDSQLDDSVSNMKAELGPTWIVFTKRDLIRIEELASFDLPAFLRKAQARIPQLETFFVNSAKTGKDLDILLKELEQRAQPGPHLYPGKAASNQSERFFVSEYIREVAYKFLNEEVPYEVAVLVEEFKEIPRAEGKGAIITATILVNRPSQRAIVIGKGGHLIREIGIRARTKIEAMIDGQVRLNLHVKVAPNWFSNNRLLEELGLPRAQDSRRVWRKNESAVQ